MRAVRFLELRDFDHNWKTMDSRAYIIRRKIEEDQLAGRGRTLRDYIGLFDGEDTVVARVYADIEEDRADPQVGGDDDHLIGPYRIIRELGKGGQGTVYLAEDVRLLRKVALKVLTSLAASSEAAVRRFRQEAKVASRLAHPGICAVYDSGVSRGVFYIAMQYVEGQTLADWISKAKDKATFDSPIVGVGKKQGSDLVAIFEKAAAALHLAHEAGVIHRDIKPANIMMSTSGDPVILDFGIARAEGLDLPTLTRTGDVLGHRPTCLQSSWKKIEFASIGERISTLLALRCLNAWPLGDHLKNTL